MRRFTNDYNPDGKEARQKTREAAGNRCLRCHHPYEAGKYGKGEWSPCDEQCTHGLPYRVNGRHACSPDVALGIQRLIKTGVLVEAQWRILTVHHLDGDKANDAWWNTLALCQRCHLEIQGKVDPEQPYFFEHSKWIRPFIGGYYARKYEGKNLTREEVMARLDELLAYECRVKA